MWKKRVSFVLAVGLAVGTAMAGPQKPHPDHGADPVLPAGHYSAKAKALVCGGCADQIEKTLRAMPALESVSVESKTRRVDFSVKAGKTLQWSALQKALKTASDKMGMGADYRLSEFKILPTEGDGALSPKTLSPGYYTAKVGAITCGGCGPLIEKTMGQVPGIGAAQVDATAGSVLFAVLVDKEVKVADLQGALRVSAEQMGMGADYQLIDIKKVDKGSQKTK
jgi:copper chaperone CopZ